MLDKSMYVYIAYVYIARIGGDKRMTCSLLKQDTDLCTPGCSGEYNSVTCFLITQWLSLEGQFSEYI